ncbi:MAG: hypothetical protein P1P89_19740 [Desulfobacterales bacterium]|nr:hypothetical protein [Desulfobacterales bacterium]
MPVNNLPADATTVVLNGRAITDLAEGDIITIEPVNPATTQINGIGGSVNINERSDKDVHNVTIRVLKYSESDSFLNNLRRQSPVPIITGSVKTAYNRDGADAEESWLLEGGSITTQPTDTKNSTDGNAMMEYVMMFRTATRNL